MGKVQLSDWKRLKENREIWTPADNAKIHADLSYERVSLSTDKKTGATTLNGGPCIRLDPIFQYKSATGRMIPYGKSTLFTWTAKMSCPSYSLPAGPPAMGGTCAASLPADIKEDGSYEKFHPPLSEIAKGHQFICSVCYAGKGRYKMYKGMSIGQVVHLEWTKFALREGVFMDSMVSALESLQSPDVEAVIRQKDVSNQYFRIHDSGDFSIDEDDELSFLYYKAWCEICEAMSQIKFWAPTRLWVYSKWREVFASTPPPENLTLRPSGLFTDVDPPDIDGLDAGTTSHQGKFGDRVKDCPVYETEDSKSCASVQCRTCWLERDRFVNYRTH